MCGICGVVGGQPKEELSNVRRMADAIAHRGPDDEGFHRDGGAALGNRRLQIIDLEGGRQPLSNEDGSLWITYNGEIYNYRELRSELKARGHRFRTECDTETILHLYEEMGEGCVERLRGMFAFAIWDAPRRTLFAARDRFGQKPFFYAVRNGTFLFASEIKALLTHPAVSSEPEPAAVDFYLTFRFVPAPLTMFRDISKLPAGHTLSWRADRVDVNRYWGLSFREEAERSEADWLAELEERLDDAVRSHLVADVPVGAFLSGGLDTSTVTALMVRHLDVPPPTFCIGSDMPRFDERPFARQVSAHCGTVHHERTVSARQLDGIPRLVRYLDEPSDPIAACFHEAARLASDHVRVVLGGDGGDELFAGFDRYAAFRWASWYRRLPRWLREDVVRPAVDRLPDTFAYKGMAQKARWLTEVGSEAGGRRYARMSSFLRFGPEEREWLYGPGLRAALDGHEPEQLVATAFEQAPAADLLHRMIHADLVTRLPEHTLMLADRLSMAYGLESRAPLLDHTLAEFCAKMPAKLKIRHGTTKYGLRRIARGLLPPGIADRTKQGFMFPVAYWLDAETVPPIRRSLRHGPLVGSEWVRADAIDRLFSEHVDRRHDHHVRIWMLLNLDAWYRMYVDGESDVEGPMGVDRERAVSPAMGER